MFYKDPPDQIIRQGDIIKGLISPGVITYNFLDIDNIYFQKPFFSIDVRFNLVAVITPCCTIQKADYIFFKKYNGILNNDMVIDFNNIFNIRRKDLGNNNEKMLPSKLLQLSDETRDILRHKLSAYYLRVPEE
ncbi:hypothetical protein B6V01_004205 [Methanosarcinales archaeon ex4572_44]|nr:MAG: hypothetical protein B6V01_004205 [Methanosarcinales archaeon ex4572_44]